MKKVYFMQSAVAIAAVAGYVSTAWATDVGMPLYEGDIAEKTSSIEVYYEGYKQDINLKRKIYRVENGQEVAYDRTYPYEKEEDRLVVRLNHYANSRLAGYVEVGATDSDGSTAKAIMFGAGLRGKIYKSPLFDLSALASFTYVPSIDSFEEYHNTGLGAQEDIFVEESYVELNGSLAVSKFIQLSTCVSLMPYGGVTMSTFDGDMDGTFVIRDYQGNRSPLQIDGSLDEDEAVSGFAGLGLIFNDAWALRAEGRFAQETSWSAGLTYFF